MPIRVACESCASRLNVPDNLAGRKVKCPKCGKPVLVANTAVTAAAPANPPRPARPQPPRKKSEPEDRIQKEPDRGSEDETVEEVRPKRKKKRKRRREPEGFSVPSWVWWLGGVAAVFLLAFIAMIAAWVGGAKKEVLAYGLALIIMLPISTVILIVSMILSSAIAGGIEFGEVHIVIPKALILLLVVNLISLIPFGGYIALLFWLFGLMMLFKLDLWEARFLVAINWALNLGVRIFIIAAVLSAAQHGRIDKDVDDDEDEPPAIQVQPQGNVR